MNEGMMQSFFSPSSFLPPFVVPCNSHYFPSCQFLIAKKGGGVWSRFLGCAVETPEALGIFRCKSHREGGRVGGGHSATMMLSQWLTLNALVSFLR